MENTLLTHRLCGGHLYRERISYDVEGSDALRLTAPRRRRGQQGEVASGPLRSGLPQACAVCPVQGQARRAHARPQHQPLGLLGDGGDDRRSLVWGDRPRSLLGSSFGVLQPSGKAGPTGAGHGRAPIPARRPPPTPPKAFDVDRIHIIGKLLAHWAT